MYKTIPACSEQAIAICKLACPEAIEINCVGGLTEGGVSANDITKESLSEFKYVSLHAPCNIIYRDDEITFKVMIQLRELCNKLHIDRVVFHPDVIEDWRMLEIFYLPWAIENMDSSKKSCKGSADLAKIFEWQDCDLVLDLNHCFTNDPSMKLADELVDEFGDRICEIHLSGYSKFHEPLFETGQLDILNHIPKGIEAPIILEGVCGKKEDVVKEYNYVNNFLRQRSLVF